MGERCTNRSRESLSDVLCSVGEKLVRDRVPWVWSIELSIDCSPPRTFGASAGEPQQAKCQAVHSYSVNFALRIRRLGVRISRTRFCCIALAPPACGEATN